MKHKTKNVKHHPRPKRTTQINHTATDTISITSYGAPIPNLFPHEWEIVSDHMQAMKKIGRYQCPSCLAIFDHPRWFGFRLRDGHLHTYATCDACTAKGLATDAGHAAILDRINAFLDGGAE